MPTVVRIDEENRRGNRDIHEVEIETSDEGVSPQPPPPVPPPQVPEIQSPLNELITVGVGEDVANESRAQLVEVDPYVIFAYKEGTQEIYGEFRIKNIAQNGVPVIHKIQTTNVSKFHVKPTIGVIRNQSTAKVLLKVNEGGSLEGLRQDKFLVQVMMLPEEYRTRLATSESDSGDAVPSTRPSFQQLNDLWRDMSTVPGAYVEKHRLSSRIQYPPSQLSTRPPTPPPRITQNATPTPIGPAPPASIQTFQTQAPRPPVCTNDNLERIMDTIDNKIDWLTMLLYGVIVMVFVALVILIFSSSVHAGNSGKNETIIQPPPVIEPNKTEVKKYHAYCV